MLVDTSVWVDHLRKRNARLAELLNSAQVVIHPLIIGELSCGNIANRSEVLSLLSSLPRVAVLEHDEVMDFVAANKLHGRGLGWIDMHILASMRLASIPLLTLDKRLATAASALAA